MNKKKFAIKCVFALVGIALIGIGVAFNAMAKLGNDPVGIFYDGIRNALGLTQTGLGIASNLVNIILAVLVFFLGRQYLSIGTLIYIIPYGTFINLGTALYGNIFTVDALWCQILASVIGCLLLYTGVAIFITVDIGIDPMTAAAMVIRDKTHWEFKTAKRVFDITLTIIGFFLGGKLGAVTIISALAAGPLIQMIADWFIRKSEVTYAEE